MMPLNTRAARRHKRYVSEALEPRTLFDGAPVEELFRFWEPGVRFQESAPLGDVLFLTGRLDSESESLYVSFGLGDVTPLFTAFPTEPTGDTIGALTPFAGKIFFF